MRSQGLVGQGSLFGCPCEAGRAKLWQGGQAGSADLACSLGKLMQCFDSLGALKGMTMCRAERVRLCCLA